MTKKELLEYAELTWNSTEPLKEFDKTKSTKVEGLEQIRIYVENLAQKEKDIRAALNNFVKSNNISRNEENEISSSIRDIFTSYMESISNKK